jgi:hypothetical protein
MEGKKLDPRNEGGPQALVSSRAISMKDAADFSSAKFSKPRPTSGP